MRVPRATWTAPDDGFTGVIEQEADGHHFESEAFDGFEAIAIEGCGACVGSEHHRDTGAVHVGVEQADASAGFGEREGHIGGDGAFSDAAFSAHDDDDISDTGDRVILADIATRDMGGPLDFHLFGAGGGDGLDDRSAQFFLRGGSVNGQSKGKLNVIAGDGDFGDRAKFGDGLAGSGL